MAGPFRGSGHAHAAHVGADAPHLYRSRVDGQLDSASLPRAVEKPAAGTGGVAVSPDGNSLLYPQNEFLDSYIMLVKNFR